MKAILYTEEVKSLTIKNIPGDVLRKFKSWAAFKGLTLNEAIIEIMREKGDYVKVQNGEHKEN